MQFGTPFDEALALSGPGAVFLVDRDGALRVNDKWTRDAWGRHDQPQRCDPRWFVARDRRSGYGMVVMVTGMNLLDDHPRLDVIPVDSFAEALRLSGPAGGSPP